MNRRKWILCGVAMALMALGAMSIARLKASQKLGRPGLKVASAEVISGLKVVLPERMLDFVSEELPPSPDELGVLPADTTIGKRLYRAPDGFETLLSVVMMGSDRTSIHKPQFCLTGQGWAIDHGEIVSVRVAAGREYELPVMKLTTTKHVEAGGKTAAVRGLYLYWFVAADRVTAKHWQRMWWMAEGLLKTGELQRWAYVSFFSTCLPGQEAQTLERMKQCIAASVPEFQFPDASAQITMANPGAH